MNPLNSLNPNQNGSGNHGTEHNMKSKSAEPATKDNHVA